MDEKFQDRIDNYLLNRMDDAEKTEFLREIEQDKEKKEQLEFTQDVKDCIRSREEKLKALKQFQRQYEQERKTAAYRATFFDYISLQCQIVEIRSESKHFACHHLVVSAERCSPFYLISFRFMICRGTHKSEIWKVMTINVN